MKDIETRYSGLLYNRYFYKLITYFKQKNATFYELDKFTGFESNIRNEDIIILDINGHGIANEMYNLIKIINKYQLNNYNFKLFYVCGDIWPVEHCPFLNNIIISLLKSKKVQMIHVYTNLDILCKLWEPKFNLSQYLHNFKYLQFNYYYKDMDIDFNNTPKNKVLLSGNIDKNIYPERFYLKNINHPNVEELKFNQVSNYITELNTYICSFVSNVSHYDINTYKKTSINCYLLKYFEVLASGSLLLSDDKVKDELIKLGLKHGENCYISSMDNIVSSIEYITNDANKDEINRIRYNGYNFYKQYKINTDIEFDIFFKDII